MLIGTSKGQKIIVQSHYAKLSLGTKDLYLEICFFSEAIFSFVPKLRSGNVAEAIVISFLDSKEAGWAQHHIHLAGDRENG